MNSSLSIFSIALVFFAVISALVIVGACVVLHRKVRAPSTFLMLLASGLLVFMQVVSFGFRFLFPHLGMGPDRFMQWNFALAGFQNLLSVCFAISLLMFALNLPARRPRSMSMPPNRTGESE